jgi:hypothetical protein
MPLVDSRILSKFHSNNSIQFVYLLFINNNNSIMYYLYAESTAPRPITDTAQHKYNNTNNTIIQFV